MDHQDNMANASAVRATNRILIDHFEDQARFLRRRDLLSIIFRLYRIPYSNPNKDFDSWVIRQFKLARRVFPNRQIREGHERLQNRLQNMFPQASSPTFFENEFFRKLKSSTSLEVLQSTWIGNGCVDIFIPGVAGEPGASRQMRGLVLEVDGPVHDQESKMRRDEHKRDQLAELRIGTMSLRNESLRHEASLLLVRKIRWMPRLDTRARRRLWRDIYLFTLVLHGTREEVSSVLGIPEHLVEELEGGMR